eukprot:GHVN01032219.1.p1 GENE.GHVN01032219.1~~GHVN01032219.1.p1  ORF type:complete len:1065 (+),score=211.42 GHVN01032219.1:276-3197(+)
MVNLTHEQLLSPLYGKENVLGVQETGSIKRMNSLLTQEPQEGMPTNDRFTTIMKIIHLELVNEMTRSFRQSHRTLFSQSNVAPGVVNFFDNILPHRVSIKAHRLLNERMELRLTDIHHANHRMLASSVPKTAQQVLAAIRLYRIQHNEHVKRYLGFVGSVGVNDLNVQVSLVTEILVSMSLLKKSEVIEDHQEVTLSHGIKSQAKFVIPKNPECYRLVAKAVELQIEPMARKLTPDQVNLAIRSICTRFLWFEAFKLLIRLLGIDMTVDEFPGSAVTIDVEDEEKYMELPSPPSGKTRFDTLSPASQLIQQRNLIRMRKVFDQLSNNSGFLAVDLADEALLLLTDSRVHYAAAVECFRVLSVAGSDRTPDDATETLEELGISAESCMCDLDIPVLRDEDVLDWTDLRECIVVDASFTQEFERLTAASPGFMGKSQMIEFVKKVQNKFQVLERGEIHELIGYEMFHATLFKMGFSIGRRHSLIQWVMTLQSSQEGGGSTQTAVSASVAAEHLVRIYLHPCDNTGNLCDATSKDVERIVSYNGYFNLNIFRRLLKRSGMIPLNKGTKALWADMPKDPMDITHFLPASVLDDTGTQFLRVQMDTLGMDNSKGFVSHIATLKKEMPKMMMSGLWPESVKVLVKLRLHIDVSEAVLDELIHDMATKANHYGLIKVEDVAKILSNLSVSGITFPMLRETVTKMRLEMPSRDVKRMFDMMDVNNDKTLSMLEMLSGFELLFNEFLPDYVCDAVGLSLGRQLGIIVAACAGLLAFFAFLGLAFSSFQGMKSGAGSAVQSVLALGGAVGLQNGASTDLEKVEADMKARINDLMDTDLNEAEKVMESETKKKPTSKPQTDDGKPQQLRYSVPSKFQPDLTDPKPCVTFETEDFVELTPTVVGRLEKSNLKFSIKPDLPHNCGLSLDKKTGLIRGVIPSDDTLRISRKTYTVSASNLAGTAKTKVTFQIQPKTIDEDAVSAVGF